MAKQPKPKKVVPKPKEGMVTKMMMAPGRTFAKGLGGLINASQAAGKKLRSAMDSKSTGATKKPMTNAKAKAKGK